ncbi:MAG: hypothetical protein AAF628_33840 [Planctomycetota bacterium]
MRTRYFALEFVDGVSRLDCAAQHALDVSARLELFVRICDAIYDAHSRASCTGT